MLRRGPAFLIVPTHPRASVETRSRRADVAFYGYGLRRWADFPASAHPDHQAMSLIDRSPGGFIFVANVILYVTVLMEALMLVTGSPLFMGGVLALIVVVAALLCRFIMNLMGSEAYTLGEEPAASAAPVAAEPVAATAPERRPAPVATGTPILH
jgi:hypothetical protein